MVPPHTVLKKQIVNKQEIKAWRPSKEEIKTGFITVLDVSF